MGNCKLHEKDRRREGEGCCVLGKTEQLSRVVVAVVARSSSCKIFARAYQRFSLAHRKIAKWLSRRVGWKVPLLLPTPLPLSSSLPSQPPLCAVPLSGLRIFGLLGCASLCTLAGCGWGKVEAYACSIACSSPFLSSSLMCWEMQNRLRQ